MGFSISSVFTLLALLALSVIPVPVLRMSDLVAASDLIVVGSVTKTNSDGQVTISASGGPVAATSIVASLSISEVLKGDFRSATVDVSFAEPVEPIGFRSIPTGSPRIFFLKRSGNAFVPTSPYYPVLPAAEGPSLLADNPTGRVIEVLARVMQSESSSTPDKLEAIEMVRGSRTAAALEGLGVALASSDRELSLRAGAALLAVRDYRGLSVLEAVVTGARIGVSDETYAVLIDGIRSVDDPTAIPFLERTLAGGDAESREAAVRALRGMKAPRAIAGMVQALSDNDIRVRYNAVIGLAEVTGKPEWGPSYDTFTSDEQRYLQAWKDWAKAR